MPLPLFVRREFEGGTSVIFSAKTQKSGKKVPGSAQKPAIMRAFEIQK